MPDFTALQKEAATAWEMLNTESTLITVGNATCGRSAGSIEVKKAIQNEAAAHGIECNVIEVGCVGLCYMEPIVSIQKPGQPMMVFGNVNVKQVKGLVEKQGSLFFKIVYQELDKNGTKKPVGQYSEELVESVKAEYNAYLEKLRLGQDAQEPRLQWHETSFGNENSMSNLDGLILMNYDDIESEVPTKISGQKLSRIYPTQDQMGTPAVGFSIMAS